MLVIETTCSEPALAAILLVVKNILGILQIIGPIAAIVSIMWQFAKLTVNPDDKKGLSTFFSTCCNKCVLCFIR